MDEIWKDIPYWYGHQVSNKGRVRSVDREVNHNCNYGTAIERSKNHRTNIIVRIVNNKTIFKSSEIAANEEVKLLGNKDMIIINNK